MMAALLLQWQGSLPGLHWWLWAAGILIRDKWGSEKVRKEIGHVGLLSVGMASWKASFPLVGPALMSLRESVIWRKVSSSYCYAPYTVIQLVNSESSERFKGKYSKRKQSVQNSQPAWALTFRSQNPKQIMFCICRDIAEIHMWITRSDFYKCFFITRAPRD